MSCAATTCGTASKRCGQGRYSATGKTFRPCCEGIARGRYPQHRRAFRQAVKSTVAFYFDAAADEQLYEQPAAAIPQETPASDVAFYFPLSGRTATKNGDEV